MSDSYNTLTPSDTIAAIATPIGIGGIGIIRISGGSLTHMAGLFASNALPPARYAALRTFVDGNGTTLDNGLAIYFPAPHSFTGEAVLELHAHGGAALLQTLLKRCFELGARQANAGEFSLRAYHNGKINLTQAEAIADMVAARSTAGVQAAARSLSGEFSQVISGFIHRLAQARAELESSLDFSDDDAQVSAARAAAQSCITLSDELMRLIQQAKQGALICGGIDVVIVGAPNTGKSSLLNRLVDSSAAIVSETAGTTRDLVERETTIGSIPFKLTDSAGLHDSCDDIEIEGMRRTRERLESADIILSLAAPTQNFVLTKHPTARVITLFNKIDLCRPPIAAPTDADVADIAISAKTGTGIEALQESLLTACSWNEDDTLFSARQRHITALQEARHFLQKARAEVAQPEVAAAWLRDCETALVSIIGTRSEEDLLATIFSQFCIGK